MAIPTLKREDARAGPNTACGGTNTSLYMRSATWIANFTFP
jgi:hypothetical protein